jgi:hypothetical protein
MLLDMRLLIYSIILRLFLLLYLLTLPFLVGIQLALLSRHPYIMSRSSTTRAVASAPLELTAGNEITPQATIERPAAQPRDSALYNALPSFVRKQIRPIQSLRHSLSMSNLSSPFGRPQSGADATLVSQRLQEELGNTEGDEFAIEAMRPSSRDGSEDLFSASTGTVTPVPAEAASGVRWIYASTGMLPRSS